MAEHEMDTQLMEMEILLEKKKRAKEEKHRILEFEKKKRSTSGRQMLLNKSKETYDPESP